MAGPRRNVAPTNTFIAALSLALAGCSFDSAGLGQSAESGQGGETSGTGGSTTGLEATTGATTSPTSGTGSGESGATGGIGESGSGGSDSSGALEPGTSSSSTGDGSTSDGSTSTGDAESTGVGESTASCVEMAFYEDKDGDGFGNPDKSKMACETPEGHVGNADDCDDGAAGIKPGADEVCDDHDNDCDGLANEFTPGTNLDCEGCKMALHDNKVYHFCSGQKSWPEAKKGCEGRGAALVEDDDDAEHDWLVGQLPANSGAWYIGAQTPNMDDNFVWLSGVAVPDPDSRWGWMRPAGGDFLTLVSDGNIGLWATFNGEWYDRDADKDGAYICEGPLPP